MNKIHIVGLGLLGGSFGLGARRKFPEMTITGTDISTQNLKDALTLGIITKAQEKPDLDTDIVILATPADTLGDLLIQTLDQVGENTLVIDLGSTKSKLCLQLAGHPKRKQYLAGHPIAGTEYSGPKAAFADLLDRKVMILCEMEKTDLHLKEKAYELFDALNLKLRFMDPEEHDRHLAFVSHLSHISSFMLGKTVLQKMEDEKNIFDMAGSGFASTVRLAKSSPAMWAPILTENKDNILASLDGYISNLTAIREKIASSDGEAIYKELEEINKIRDILDLGR
ncbi:MAG TPA: prephenate dehydrogenase [Algoriphagus sp.]|jgi:prephenate dehydrogenase|uniref:prephenate dehydrogenase n=1 Tax=unclassified Algoriphagus TaxID=2641541 RepID=UPI000C5C70A7|nr:MULTISPECIES: prephenate dehydrogenase [unclassified Algoriphagus]MAL14710.1 prephenate dehydrogenase [Algoriphagus sp.]HAD53358.1 prephenate dehydrogenase [Algoriphagus sp.]HAH36032.1 prephenate dehydrogenase [Algoriphagus sp.]HAZ24751.1 prephenate dehydrogenase [Algoriphagus sp.]HCB46985.1 prephenate dehydrogenase [Algoriphagus sp.]|tara:strand:+ start:261 stop:1109 length:849 start_codon:yes stop_codon:yes gene_type:complete